MNKRERESGRDGEVVVVAEEDQTIVDGNAWLWDLIWADGPLPPRCPNIVLDVVERYCELYASNINCI